MNLLKIVDSYNRLYESIHIKKYNEFWKKKKKKKIFIKKKIGCSFSSLKIDRLEKYGNA